MIFKGEEKGPQETQTKIIVLQKDYFQVHFVDFMLHVANADLKKSNFNLEKLLKTCKKDLENLEFCFSKMGRHPEHWLPC